MSVFKDFQKAWSQRFPECDLPKAWADDVRGNLEKHQHKVALLKEELEKEEFYVNYLERLLKDVNKAKVNSTNDPKDKTIIPLPNKDQSKEEANPDSYVTVITVSSYGEENKQNTLNLHSLANTGHKDDQKWVIYISQF